MKITRVEFFGEPKRNFIRYAVIVLDDSLVIRGLKLISRRDGSIFVAMPQIHGLNGPQDIVYPSGPAARRAIEEAILTAWSKYPQPKIHAAPK
jgi:DNA-binding cell septation regulator SpoVG